jgi:hypothetical protein
MGGVQIADINGTRVEAVEVSQEVLFNDVPAFLNEKTIKAIRTWSMTVGKVFYNRLNFLRGEFSSDWGEVLTLEETGEIIMNTLKIICTQSVSESIPWNSVFLIMIRNKDVVFSCQISSVLSESALAGHCLEEGGVFIT